jgi:hypothetical protein
LKDFEIKFVLNNGRNEFSFSCPHGQLKENLYEMPTLMYSLEVLLPTKPYTCIDKLEIFLEKKYAKTDTFKITDLTTCGERHETFSSRITDFSTTGSAGLKRRNNGRNKLSVYV